MRGAVAVSFNLNDLTVTQGEEVLILYQFNTALEQYRVNVACIEGMSPFDFPEVPVLESRNHTKTAWRAAQALPVGCVTRTILSDFMACERPYSTASRARSKSFMACSTSCTAWASWPEDACGAAQAISNRRQASTSCSPFTTRAAPLIL